MATQLAEPVLPNWPVPMLLSVEFDELGELPAPVGVVLPHSAVPSAATQFDETVLPD